MAEPSRAIPERGSERRERILEAALGAVESFLGETAWQDRVGDVLAALGEATGASRAFLYRYREANSESPGSVTRLGRWQRPDLDFQLSNPTSFEFGDDEEPELRAALRAGRPVTIPLSELPRHVLDLLPVRTGWVAVVPVLVGTELWGAVGLVDFERSEPWNEAETDTLASSGSALGSAVHRERAIRDLRRSERRFKALVDNIPAVVYCCANDATYSMTYLSSDVEELTGYPAEEFLAGRLSLTDLYHADDAPNVPMLVERALEAREPFSLEYRLRHADGSWRWIEERGQGVFDPDTGELDFLEGSLIDITERKEIERQLIHSAFRDSLTDLPNRALFLDRVALAVERGERREGSRFAVVFIDLDDFKLVNDGLGHLVGDRLLVAVGRRLRRCVRPGDTVARIGGDEFAILADGIGGRDDAEGLAARVAAELAAPYTVEGQEIFCSGSLGLSLSDRSYGSPEEMLRDADTAMYRAKEGGRGRYAFFEPSMHSSALSRLQVESELQRALEREELVLLFQPIVDLDKGCLRGAEALLRWQRPSRGLVRPSEFLEAAARTNLLPELGRWVFDNACRALAEWHDLQADLAVGINLHPDELARPGLARELSDALERWNVPPSRVCLELTEQVMLTDPVRSALAFEELRELGVLLSLDDFGQGYSSLAYLHHYPIDSLKLDRSFLREDGARDRRRLLKSLALLARGLEVRTVAEGVESREHLDLVREAGLDMAQGHYFSKPLTDVSLVKALRERKTW